MSTLQFDPLSGQDRSIPSKAERRIVACFSDEERGRFLNNETSAISELADAFGAQVYWTKPELSHGQWHDLLLEVSPEVIVGAWSLPALTDDLVEQLPHFKYLCYFCGSIRGKVSESFVKNGGVVTNWGGLASGAVAECALALVLACARRMSRYTLEMHVDKSYNGLGEPYPLSVAGRRVGVHGIGAVARHCIQLLRPFGVSIECWSEGAPEHLYRQAGVSRAQSLAALFADNDIVIEAEALTPHTEGSVTAAMLYGMRPSAIFVNVGRAAVVEAGAVEALAARGDVAIGLDVYHEEPLPADSVLRGMRNVMLLPHTAGPTVDQYAAIREQSLGFLRDYLSGKQLAEKISADAYRRMT